MWRRAFPRGICSKARPPQQIQTTKHPTAGRRVRTGQRNVFLRATTPRWTCARLFVVVRQGLPRLLADRYLVLRGGELFFRLHLWSSRGLNGSFFLGLCLGRLHRMHRSGHGHYLISGHIGGRGNSLSTRQHAQSMRFVALAMVAVVVRVASRRGPRVVRERLLGGLADRDLILGRRTLSRRRLLRQSGGALCLRLYAGGLNRLNGHRFPPACTLRPREYEL